MTKAAAGMSYAFFKCNCVYDETTIPWGRSYDGFDNIKYFAIAHLINPDQLQELSSGNGDGRLQLLRAPKSNTVLNLMFEVGCWTFSHASLRVVHFPKDFTTDKDLINIFGKAYLGMASSHVNIDDLLEIITIRQTIPKIKDSKKRLNHCSHKIIVDTIDAGVFNPNHDHVVSTYQAIIDKAIQDVCSQIDAEVVGLQSKLNSLPKITRKF